MADESPNPARRVSAELVAIIVIGVALFGQATLQNNRVNDRIDKLQEGQGVIRERLAVVESHVLGVPSVAQIDPETDPQTTP